MTNTAFPLDTEGDVRAYLKRELKEIGGQLRKVSWFPRSHAPDEIVFLPPRGNYYPATLVWVELKRPGQKPRAGQQRALSLLKAHGQQAVWINSREGVDALLARRWAPAP